jgi:uncharacterized membrane protein YraQ (UPF0718 family)
MSHGDGAAGLSPRKPLPLWRYAAIGALLGSVAAATIISTCKPFAPGDGADAAYIWTHLVSLPVGLVVEAILESVAEPRYAGIAFLLTAPIFNGTAAALLWGVFVRRHRPGHPSSMHRIAGELREAANARS